jgi:hypothetical protein
LKHQHIYYTTKEAEKRVKTDNINMKITTKESAKREAERMVREITRKMYKIGKRKPVDHKNYCKVCSTLMHCSL